MRQIVWTPLAVLLVVACAATPVWGDWEKNGTPVCMASGEQRYPWIVEDGIGGAFMAWEDARSGNRAIYAQRIDSAGVTLWTPDGIPVSTVAGEKYRPILVRDGSGGVIICWYDLRNGSDLDIYAQRLDGAGNALWTADGVTLCTAAGDQLRALSIMDGSGGAIVTWYDFRNGNWDIFAQRIDPDGTVLWTGNGVAVCQTTGDQEYGKIVSDEAGGAIIAWYDSRGGDYDIYAQRLDPDGNSLWTPNGVLLCGAAGDQNNVVITSDGFGGAIVSWDDGRHANKDIYAQSVDAFGAINWAADGEAICTDVSDAMYPSICSDGAGGAFIIWRDWRNPVSEIDVFMQKINASGTVQWEADGIPLCDDQGNQVNIHVIPDGSGGIMSAWRDRSTSTDIAAQRVHSDGSTYYKVQSIGVCRQIFTQTLGHLAPDGTGGAIIVWYDIRSLEYDIYAYRVSFGDVEYPPEILSVKDVPEDQGGWLSIEWKRSDVDTTPNNPIAEYRVWHWRPLYAMQHADFGNPDSVAVPFPAGGDNFPTPGPPFSAGYDNAALRVDLTASSYDWYSIQTVSANGSDTYSITTESPYDSVASEIGWQYFIVVAYEDDQAIFYESIIDSGYSIDNIAPHPPMGLAADYLPPPDNLLLSWWPNTDPDLSHYRVYRNKDEDFIPSEETLIAETPDTSLYDPQYAPGEVYFYRLSACDVHGNEGESVVIQVEQTVATLLQSFSAGLSDEGILITWRLSSIDEGVVFYVLRSNDHASGFVELGWAQVSKSGLDFWFVDDRIDAGLTYRYRVGFSDGMNKQILFETEPISTPELPLTLYQNHPNPFNPGTSIAFYLPAAGRVVLDIFDVSGRRVVTLRDAVTAKGSNSVSWDGTGEGGEAVSSGVYFYRIRFGGTELTKKMILLR